VIVLAHGLGGRSDLPVPLWLAMYAATAAVVISFIAVLAFWPRPRLAGDAGREVPPRLQRVADSPVTRAALRACGVLLGALFLLAAWTGVDSAADNPAPTWFYVWFWVGLVPASVLLGPVWRLLNPLRGVVGVLLLARGGRPVLAEDQARRIVERAGYWPAVIGVAAFVWLELVYTQPDRPRTVALFVTGYALVHTVGGLLVGQRWFDRGDGFEAYSTLLARLAPLGRRPDGRLVLRNPLAGLAGVTAAPGLVAFVCVLLGSTAFDGLSRTALWRTVSTGTSTAVYLLSGTLGLVASAAAVAAIYHGALGLTRPFLAADHRGGLAMAFAHTLVPIAIGYTVAHYFSLVVFQGQAGVLLATDPFGRGWDLLGTAGARIDYTVLSTATIALVQVGAIVAGHILGVVAAHDRAVAVLARRHLRRGQYPMLAAMITYTGVGIALLVGT